jgi:hypothetical protein
LILQEVLGGRLSSDHHAGERFEAGELGRSPPPFTHHHHVATCGVIPSHADRLELAALAEASGQPGEGLGVELRPGLIRVRDDPVEADHGGSLKSLPALAPACEA